ncbi:HEPN domain-containing protein [Pseudoalteromonas maricaloris]|uniref:HEPN domain-containing protein n=1 Tax=Pseudoalteromonas maricaloris TaxID=184924 RepID=A0A8I2KKM6_9GAMM|nr:HEPN domain-containing protein [Pseudoalteromonas maricaloris]NLR20659.1 hypothetical protein [Pseudoalteromonas maricaloris]WOX29857.1 HEPN domain-containing protein [Pseudoalteromonas maricaloris]
MNVEYLVVIDAKEPICKSVDSFGNLLQANDGIKISGDKITYADCSFGYDVSFDNVDSSIQRYFHLTLTLFDTRNESQFLELLRLLKSIIGKISGRQPEVLWDDISSNRCNEAYPVIHETENLLRKLITKFMFANLGLKWTKEAVPEEVDNSIKVNNTTGDGQSNSTKKTNSRSGNYLYQLDFIQLSKLLFKEYSTGSLDTVNQKISEATSIESLDIDELRELVPKSNWERYFSPIVNCDSSYLEKKWSRLYDLRCKVAHNRFITEAELVDIKKSTQEVNKFFKEAIDKLKQVNITDEQKEEVAENLIKTSNQEYSRFLEKCEGLKKKLLGLLEYDPSNSKEEVARLTSWKDLKSYASENTYLGTNFFEVASKLLRFRNELVHRPDLEVSSTSILEQLSVIEELEEEIDEAMECIAISWTRGRDGC